MIWFN